MNAMLLFLIVPVAVFLAVGFIERHKITSLVDFFQHGGKISRFQFFATLTSSTAGLASTLVLIALYGYLYGLGVLLWVTLFWWLTQWASVKTIQAVERHEPGFWERRGTLHEYLGRSFNSRSVRVVAALLSVICYTILLVAEVILAYRLVYAAVARNDGIVTSFPLEIQPAVVFGVILVVAFLYTSMAGFRAVVRTDVVQFGIIGIMILTVLAFIGSRLPEIIERHAEVFGSTVSQSVLNPVMRDPLQFIFFFVVMNLLFWTAWWPVAMDQWHRCAAAASADIPTDKEFGTAGHGARLYVLLLAAAVVLIGASTRVFIAPGAEVADPLPVFVRAAMPGGALAASNTIVATLVAGIVLMGLFAAVLSTIDTYLVVVSQSVVSDIVLGSRSTRTLSENDQDSEIVRRFLPKARRLVILWLPVVLVTAWLVSHITLDAFNIVYMAFSFQMAFICVLLIALCRKGRGRGKAALVSLILGGTWCAITFPLLIVRLDAAIGAGDLDTMYSVLDLMFANTVLVGAVAGLCFGAACILRIDNRTD